MWASLIFELLKYLGPVLLEWLRKFLENRLERAAAKLPDFATYATEHDARDAVFQQAIDDLPRFAYARRALFHRLKLAASDAGVTTAGTTLPLNESEVEEIAALAGAADSE